MYNEARETLFFLNFPILVRSVYISFLLLLSSMSCTAAASSTESLGDLVTAALHLHKSGQSDAALDAYSAVIPLLPPGELLSTIRSNAGSILSARGDYDGAREMFTAAVDANPHSSQARFNLAVTLSSKFNLDSDALTHCIAAIKLNSRNHKGDCDFKLPLVQRLMFVCMNLCSAYHLMGNIFQNMGKENHAQKYFLLAENIAREDAMAETSGQRSSAANVDLPIFDMTLGQTIEIEVEGLLMIIECRSERPLIVLVRNFALPDECAHIVARAEPQLSQSFLIGTNGVEENPAGGTASNLYRSSKNTWLSVDEVLSRFQARIAAATGIPHSYITQESEELQVVKYDAAGCSFRVHHDSSAFQKRLLTALIYLTEVSDTPAVTAGETWFPFTGGRERNFDGVVDSVGTAVSKAQLLEEIITTSGEFVENSVELGRELRIKPVRGEAIIFFNHLPSGVIDPAAVHAGLPTPSNSIKWIANYWVQLDYKKLHHLMNS